MSSTPPPPSASERRPQFSLFGMLLLVGGLCFVMGAITWGPLGGYMAFTLCLFSAVVLHAKLQRYAVRVFCLWLLASGLVWLLLPMVGSAQEPARRNGCLNLTKKICRALENYEKDYGCYPPAYTTDAAGNRLHSWRTLLLPYLDEQALYDSIDLSLPWDDPANLAEFDKETRLYQCPSYSGPYRTTTYVAVVGPETMWPGAQSRTKQEVIDGLATTILIVETRRGDIHWAEPRDLTLDEILAAHDAGDTSGLSSQHSGGIAFVGFVDGHAQPVVTEEVDRETLRALLTIAGGEVYDQDALEDPPSYIPPGPNAQPSAMPAPEVSP